MLEYLRKFLCQRKILAISMQTLITICFVVMSVYLAFYAPYTSRLTHYINFSVNLFSCLFIGLILTYFYHRWVFSDEKLPYFYGLFKPILLKATDRLLSIPYLIEVGIVWSIASIVLRFLVSIVAFQKNLYLDVVFSLMLVITNLGLLAVLSEWKKRRNYLRDQSKNF